MVSYEVQGRRTERGADGRVVRDEVRLASVADRDAAFRIADAMAADAFTVWVFKTEQRCGRKTYVLLERRTGP